MVRWTEKKIRAEAAKYSTASDFKKGSAGAYDAANRLRIHDKLGFIRPNTPSKWTEEAVRAEALGYSSKSEFSDKCRGGYARACKLGIIDQLFQNKTISWSEETVRQVAKQCKGRKDFAVKQRSAYAAAIRLGILDDLGFSRVTGGNSGMSDTVYVWRAIGMTHLGIPLYKIGITSSHRSHARIKDVARDAGVQFDVIFFENVGVGNAYRVERLLHRIGTDPELKGFDGCTEFRALTATQLETVLDILVNNVCS